MRVRPLIRSGSRAPVPGNRGQSARGRRPLPPAAPRPRVHRRMAPERGSDQVCASGRPAVASSLGGGRPHAAHCGALGGQDGGPVGGKAVAPHDCLPPPDAAVRGHAEACDARHVPALTLCPGQGRRHRPCRGGAVAPPCGEDRDRSASYPPAKFAPPAKFVSRSTAAPTEVARSRGPRRSLRPRCRRRRTR